MNSTSDKYFSRVADGFLFVEKNKDMSLVFSALSLGDKEKVVVGSARVIVPVTGELKDQIIDLSKLSPGLYSINAFPGTIFQICNPEFFVDGE